MLGKAFYIGSEGDVKNENWESLKQFTQTNGYKQLAVYGNGKVKHILVHRLVASAYVHNPFLYKSVNHINGIKDDNSSKNLAWCNHKQNLAHAADTGLMKSGVASHASKLSADQALDIYHNKEELTYKQLSEKYHISTQNITAIRNGISWRKVTNHKL